MKRDPEHEPPQLWILKSTGSFSFEFMGGGRAVVCGYESLTLPSVLGERPCVGMVGGVVYFRGPTSELPPDVTVSDLNEDDIAWLDKGLDEFLENIGQSKIKRELSFWRHWRKLEPRASSVEDRLPSMRDFRERGWFPDGLFADSLRDDFSVAPLAPAGEAKLRAIVRTGESCRDCRACLSACPQGAMRRRDNATPEYSVNDARCIGCGICAAVCPENAWSLVRSRADKDAG